MVVSPLESPLSLASLPPPSLRSRLQHAAPIHTLFASTDAGRAIATVAAADAGSGEAVAGDASGLGVSMPVEYSEE